jgi:hypothetical protein
MSMVLVDTLSCDTIPLSRFIDNLIGFGTEMACQIGLTNQNLDATFKTTKVWH